MKLSAYDPWGLPPNIKNVMDDPGYLGKFWVGGLDHYRSIFFVNPISQPIIEMIKGVYQVHP